MAFRLPFAAAKPIAALALLTAPMLVGADQGARAAPEPAAPASAVRPGLRAAGDIDIEDAASAVRYRLANLRTTCASDAVAAAIDTLIGRARRIVIVQTGRYSPEGARLSFVSLDGRDLGELLIAQGVARPERVHADDLCRAEAETGA